MPYLSGALVTTIAAVALVFTPSGPGRSDASASAAAALSGTWVVKTTCTPRCYPSPKRSHNTSIATVVLSATSSRVGSYAYAPKKSGFAKSPLVLLPLGMGRVALHTHI